MRLGELWFDPGRLQIMRFCFRQVALFEKRTSKVDMSIDETRINLHSLPILRNCLLKPPVFFQEGPIAIPRRRRPWSQPDGSFAFRSRLLVAAESLEKRGVAGMVLGVVRVDPKR